MSAFKINGSLKSKSVNVGVPVRVDTSNKAETRIGCPVGSPLSP